MIVEFPQSFFSTVETNLISIHEDMGSIPGFAQWVKGSGVAVSCCVDHKRGQDPVLLCCGCSLAAAARFET